MALSDPAMHTERARLPSSASAHPAWRIFDAVVYIGSTLAFPFILQATVGLVSALDTDVRLTAV